MVFGGENVNKRYRIFTIFFIIIFSLVVILEYNKLVEFYNDAIEAFHHSDTGKRLVIGRANDSISLDPADTTEMDSFKVTVNIFDTLVKYEKEGSKIVPDLAESWKSSEDGLTWVFRLRQGVRFHDGTAFDAHAVEFNFQRWMDDKNPYHMGHFSYWNYIFGGFPGFVKSVTALSDYSIEIKLYKPYAPFLSALAMPVFGIASPEAIKKYGDEVYKHPVGTGPFRLKSWEQNKSIVLVRNDNYWGGNVKTDEVEFRVIPSDKERLEQLQQGMINIADNLSSDYAQVIEKDQELQLYLRPSFNVGYMALNNEKPPFNKRTVRVAINYAINKEGLIKDVYANMAKPAKTYVPPLLWGYDESIQPYEYNPERAKALLTEAGYPEGFRTTLWVMNSSRNYFPKPMQVAQYIQENLKQVNIEVTIKAFDWDEYLNRIDNGEHEMALIGWTGDIIDPDNFLYTLLSSDNAKPGLAGNYSFYKNNVVDQLLIQARQNSNMVFRKNLYENLLKIVNYDSPSVPLVHTMPILAGSVNVKGYAPFITGVESLENVEVEK